MMSETPRDLVAFLKELPRRCVRATRHPCVFKLRLPFLPFFAKRAEAGRRQLVKILRRRHPFVLLSLVVWNGDDWLEVGNVVRRSEGGVVLELGQEVSTEELLERLYEGGWTAVFFDQAKELEKANLPRRLPTHGPALFELLGMLGAAALISSWYDDAEWTVALAHRSAGNRPD